MNEQWKWSTNDTGEKHPTGTRVSKKSAVARWSPEYPAVSERELPRGCRKSLKSSLSEADFGLSRRDCGAPPE
jgi:hypothetical protein